MRITSSMYYDNVYANNNNKLSRELFDVNKQIASRLKIEYASDDVRVFTETMRLDNEITVLSQVKNSTENGYKVSNQTDQTLNDFTENLNRMKTLLIQAASAANDKNSLNAIASELRGVESSLKSLANTSINGQYIFAGSAFDVAPIAEDGTYKGNNLSLNAFLGSNNKQAYNLSGAELFLGEEPSNSRKITTNVVNKNLLADYPELQMGAEDQKDFLSESSTIRQLMGDNDDVADAIDKHFFYIRGTASDGTSFKNKVAMNDQQTIGELLEHIGGLYGNTPNLKLVNVNINASGQIVIEDRQKGSSKIDFHMVGAVDYNTGVGGAADVSDLDFLDGGETNFKNIANPIPPATANNLFVKEFVKSGLNSAIGAASNIEGLVYERTEFSKDGAKLSSNVSQILKEDNSFATNSTKLGDVFSGQLNSKALIVEGNDISGNPYRVNINLEDTPAGSTFTVGGYPLGSNTFNIFDVAGNNVAADDMTYKQLMDIVNMAITGELPAAGANTPTDFHNSVESSTTLGETFLSYDGKIQFGQKNITQTKASVALYDLNSQNFSSDASIATFNANNALTVTDPKTDFFKTIDQIISAVEEHKLYPDSGNSSPRGVGIQNAISMVDDLMGHVNRSQTTVGAQSNSLNRALERTEILQVSTMSLRSSVIDTDLAEASLKLTQLSLNYQAMLSTVGRVSKLSLVNYL